MWWKCEDGRYVNMRHMASLTVESPLGEKWYVYACELGEQSKYLIKILDDEEKAKKLAEDIKTAEK